MDDESFYIKYKGRITGPFDINHLHASLRRGLITRAHLISSDRTSWTSVGVHPALQINRDLPAPEVDAAFIEEDSLSQNAPLEDPTAVFAGVSNVQPDIVWTCRSCGASLMVPVSMLDQQIVCSCCGQPDRVRRNQSDLEGSNHAELREVQVDSKSNLWFGIACGALALVAIHLPVMRDSERYYFWWDFVADGSTGFAVLWSMIVLSATAICVVSPLVRGLARGIVFTALSLTWMSVALFAVDTLLVLWFVLWFWFAPFAALSGAVSWLQICRESIGARLTLCISGAVASLTSIVVFIYSLTQIIQSRTLLSTSEDVLAFAMVISTTAIGLAAGVLGIISIKPTFSRGLNETARYASHAAVFVFPAGILLLLTGEGWIIITILKGLIFYSILYILAWRGVLEIGVASSAQVSARCE